MAARFQYSTGLKASISFSRSTTSFKGDGLDPACGDKSLFAALDAAIEDRGDFVSDDAVEQAAGLLGIDQGLVDFSGIVEGF